MKKNLEIEYKTLVTQDQFTQFKKTWGYDVLVEQTNVYYDATPSLSNRKFTMRIRDLKDEHLFTLKIPQNEGLMEYEIETTQNDLSVLSFPELTTLLNKFDIHGPFHVCGQVKTKRYLKRVALGELCMDHSQINGVDDYEIEFETQGYPEEGLLYFKNLLKEVGIDYIANNQSKYYRCVLKNKE